MTLSGWVRKMRAAVAASTALQEYGERQWTEHRAAHGCRRFLSGCRLEETPEYTRLNDAAGEAIDALPAGSRSVAALDWFAFLDLADRRAARSAS